ncbi:MAG: hypothetical protein MI867_18015 [Pseudomonadales bacterium]|nr:hypothetical protein [Pseudomonadales bacterium]
MLNDDKKCHPNPWVNLEQYRDIGLLFLLAVLVGVYWAGLGGGFIYDDFANIVLNPTLRIEQFSLASLYEVARQGEAGPLGRPVAVVSFALNYLVDGMNPFGFKLVNLFIHLVTTLLVFRCAYQALLIVGQVERRAMLFAGWGAAFWALHPIHVSAVLYVVQRMALLSGMFSFAALYSVLLLIHHLNNSKRSEGVFASIAAFIVTLVLGALSKESSLLLVPISALLMVVFLNKANALHSFMIRGKALPLYVLLTIVAVGVTYAAQSSGFLGGYSQRDFTLMERLLTESRVLFLYLKWILVPDLGEYALIHDDIVLSKALWEPGSTFVSVIALCVSIWAALAFSVKYKLLCAGWLLFLIGHMLESSILPLVLVFEHRNYFPMFGIVLMIFALAISIADRFPERQTALAVLGICLTLVFGTLTSIRAWEWGDERRMFQSEVVRHPLSAGSRAELSRILGNHLLYELQTNSRVDEDTYKEFKHQSEHAIKLSDDLLSPYFSFLMVSSQIGKPVSSEWLQRFYEKIANDRYRAADASNYEQMYICYSKGRCKIQGQIFKEIYEAFQTNKYVNKSIKKMSSDIYGRYLYQNQRFENAAEVFLNVGVPLGDIDLLKNALVALDMMQNVNSLETVLKAIRNQGTSSSELESVLAQHYQNCCGGANR